MKFQTLRNSLPLILTFAVVSGFSLIAFLMSLSTQHNAVKRQFDQSASLQAALIQRSLLNHSLILESMQSLYMRSAATSRADFGAFVQPFESQLAGVQALQWVQIVRDTERDEFERARQSEGVAGFEIRERAPDGMMVRAARRPTYYPIYPVQPLDEGEATIGYDLGSDPVRNAAVQAAIASGEAAATDWVSLIQGQGETNMGFLVVSPLYTAAATVDTASEAEPVIGLVVGVFQISAIIEAARQLLNATGIELAISETVPSGVSLSFPELPGPGGGTARNVFAMSPPDAYETELPIAGKRWRFVAQPAAGYMNDKLPYASWLILLSGMLLTFLLSGFLWLYARQTLRREQALGEKHAMELQFMRSQKMETMGQLVTGIAHDFNNILGSLMGFTDLARIQQRKNGQDPKLEDYLDKVSKSAIRGKELVDKMLKFSREKPSQIEPMALEPALQTTLALIEPLLPPRISIEFHADQGLPVVMADSVGLGQALANLLINARDAIAGQGLIKLDLRHCEFNGASCSSCGAEVGGAFVQLSVSDTGTGMSADVQREIFAPFFSTKDSDKGTGMGLSILHNILHRYGGHIIVESRPGVGTTFLLLFPIPDNHA